MQSAEKQKIVRGEDGWKREFDSEKNIENYPGNTPETRYSANKKDNSTPNIPKPITKKDNLNPKPAISSLQNQ